MTNDYRLWTIDYQPWTLKLEARPPPPCYGRVKGLKTEDGRPKTEEGSLKLGVGRLVFLIEPEVLGY